MKIFEILTDGIIVLSEDAQEQLTGAYPNPMSVINCVGCKKLVGGLYSGPKYQSTSKLVDATVFDPAEKVVGYRKYYCEAKNLNLEGSANCEA